MDIKEWAARPEVLELESQGEDVEFLQNLLNRFMEKSIRPLNPDGDYGKLTKNAVIMYQQDRLLNPDGEVGGMTKKDMLSAFGTNWSQEKPFELSTSTGPIKVWGSNIDICGQIPYSFGEISTFGGPKDTGDLMYGQAYVTGSDLKSPKAFCEKNRELVEMGILRKECLAIDSYPIVKIGGKDYRASGSWCLDPWAGWYCAIYTKKSFGLYGAKNPRVVVINPKTGQVGVFLRTDQGPNPLCGAIDLPNHVEKTMGLSQDDDAIIGWADWDVAPGYKGIVG
jgi:hypothetical protein